MPINKTKRENGYGEKLQVKVVTVDKEKRRVECATRDGAMIFAAVWETGTIFRWPEVGETWTVRKDTGIWRMDAIVQSNITELESEHVPTTLAELPEGATRIVGDQIHMANVNSEDIVSSGQITATNQSLVTHVDITPRTPLTAFSYANGEIWSDNSEILNFDGVVPQAGQRVLLKEQMPEVNGIYEVVYFENTKFAFGNVSAFTEQEITSTLKFTTFEGSGFRTLPTVSAGSLSASGWSPPSYATVGGIQWTTPIIPSSSGVITQVSVPAFTWPGEGRYFALWTNMPDDGTRTGYRVAFVCTTSGTLYNVYIQKITNGVGTGQVTEAYVITAPFTLQMVSAPNGVSLYANNTGILFYGDTQYVENTGMGAIEGSGSNPLFTNYRISPAPLTGGAVRTKWRLKRASDDLRQGQKIVVSEGGTRKNTEYPITEVTEEATKFEEWHVPTLLGSWVNYGDGVYDTAGFRKTADGQVFIKGLIKAGGFSSPAPIFTLPSGYRPRLGLIFAQKIYYNNGSGFVDTFARLDVQASGTVQLWAGTGTEIVYFSMSCSFFADGN